MNRIWKGSIFGFIVIGLLAFSIIPAFASTSCPATKSFYSYNGTFGFYIPGSFSTRFGRYFQPTTPTPAKPTVPVTPTQPTTPPAKPTVPTAPTQPTTPANPAPSNPATGLTSEESKMVNLVNQERMNQGIKPLSVNMQLVNLARLKSQDMVKNNYFDHTSPTYGSPFDMMRNAGIKYTTAGENIAGAATTESAHQNLMNSPGHRANILNPSFNQVGIGIAQGSPYGNIFTQMFIGN
ncbi:MAG: CAP domain-containing protein [Bacillota bacterium]